MSLQTTLVSFVLLRFISCHITSSANYTSSQQKTYIMKHVLDRKELIGTHFSLISYPRICFHGNKFTFYFRWLISTRYCNTVYLKHKITSWFIFQLILRNYPYWNYIFDSMKISIATQRYISKEISNSPLSSTNIHRLCIKAWME